MEKEKVECPRCHRLVDEEEVSEPVVCPYGLDLYGDEEPGCYCCYECQSDCALDI